MSIDLTGRRVLVTGAGQRGGRGIALGFAAAGAEVVVNDLDIERAARVVDEIRELGADGRHAVFDVTDFDAITAAVEGVGPVDVLVNNAGNAGAEGFGGRARFADSAPADWEPFLRVNLHGRVTGGATTASPSSKTEAGHST